MMFSKRRRSCATSAEARSTGVSDLHRKSCRGDDGGKAACWGGGVSTKESTRGALVRIHAHRIAGRGSQVERTVVEITPARISRMILKVARGWGRQECVEEGGCEPQYSATGDRSSRHTGHGITRSLGEDIGSQWLVDSYSC